MSVLGDSVCICHSWMRFLNEQRYYSYVIYVSRTVVKIKYKVPT